MPRHGYASLKYLRGWYDVINKNVYGGRLPQAEIVIGDPSWQKFNPAGTRMWFRDDKVEFRRLERVKIIIRKSGMTEAVRLLIHEMVHVRYPKWEHGVKFDREIMRVRESAVSHKLSLF